MATEDVTGEPPKKKARLDVERQSSFSDAGAFKASSNKKQQTNLRVFNALDTGDGVADGSVDVEYFTRLLRTQGLQKDDPRLAKMFEAMKGKTDFDGRGFAEVTASCTTLVHRALSGEMTIPDFKGFSGVIDEVYKTVLPNLGGHNASYIPHLDEDHIDPHQFGISVCSVNGQRYSVGDIDKMFAVQSCSKPISYLIADSLFGTDKVHRHVGTEPSGLPFNSMALKTMPGEGDPDGHGGFKKIQIPHNPCINAGAIMACSMVYPEDPVEVRVKKAVEVWKRLGAGRHVRVNHAMYLSERGSADRNMCLSYMMKEVGAFPKEHWTGVQDILDTYFQMCSIELTNDTMAIIAATLANGGQNPLTGDRIFGVDSTRNALTVMCSAGMYDYSGQWAFEVGVPAKSGVGGCVMICIPNVCGISIWSPRLDDNGNSTRGVHAATVLGKRFNFHSVPLGGVNKIDPTLPKDRAAHDLIERILFASAQGDLGELEMIYQAGNNLYVSDYDKRTALHLACAEGKDGCVNFLVDKCPQFSVDDPLTRTQILSAKDRWGGTPLNDATNSGNENCIKILKRVNAEMGAKHDVLSEEEGSQDDNADGGNQVVAVLFAASEGDVDELVKLYAGGANLFAADYDLRTALHLAASEGHESAVRYLLLNAPGDAVNAKDRWGATPRDDAVREKHDGCLKYIDGHVGQMSG